MVGDRLHERARLACLATHGGLEGRVPEQDLRLLGNEALRVGEVDELFEPQSQERRVVSGLERELVGRGGSRRLAEQLREGRERLLEHELGGSRFDVELELGGVVDPAIRH